MSDSPSCIDCGARAPETNTNYTLISTSFGWRLSRRKDASGGVVVEWRCPACWKKFKTARVTDHKTTGAFAPVSPVGRNAKMSPPSTPPGPP
jgi:hypothetical protein